MKPDARHAEPASATAVPGHSDHACAAALAIFVVIGTAAIANQLGKFWPVQPLLNAAFASAALVAAIAAFTPTLAWPNVVLAGGLAAVIGGMAHAVSSVTGFPFGQAEYTDAAGPRLLGLIPWWLPVAWAVTALGSRGAARFALHQSRNHPQHGYRVIALATGLAMLSTIGLQAFAVRAHYGMPTLTDELLPWLGQGLHLFIQIAMTPLLIDKFPGPRPPNFRPLLVWAGTSAVMLAGLIAR